MSDDTRIPGRTPKCRNHPEAEARRKRIQGLDFAFCSEGQEMLGRYCMSEQNGDYCQYLVHTTATHMDLTGVTWVDCDFGEEEMQTDF